MIIVGDIGGSHMRIAASTEPDSFEEPVVCDTPKEFDAAVAACKEAVEQAARGRPITSGMLGVAGLLSPDRTVVLRAPHLKGWEGKNAAEAFSAALGAPVRLENDVALGALGEAYSGAGRGAPIVAYIAVGTGVGGARVVNGRIDPTALGFEIGHQLLGIGTNAPEWESLVSGSGLERRYGMPSTQLTDPAAWEASADHFAYGLYNTILHWSPQRVVLGGSLFLHKSIPLARVKATLRSIATALPELPEIHLAAHGDHAGLYGALVLATD